MKKIVCTDYSVSGEKFELIFDSSLELYATHPQPSEEDLPFYYKSEDYISHTDSRKTLIEKIYQIVKKYTIGKKVALLESFKTTDKNLLDVGCGTGDFLKVAADKSWLVTGIEPNKRARGLAGKKLEKSNSISTQLDDLLENTLQHEFDIITLWHVLEHVPNLNAYIEKIKKLLKEDGYLIIAVPNYKSYDAQHYKQHWAAYDVPRHLWHFSQKSIHKIFKTHKMQVDKILPMRFDSYYVSLLSEKYKTGKGSILKAFYSGLISNWKAKKTTEYSSLIYVLKKCEM